jgi:ribosomal protein S18 acetylase RimI-like enzyme
VHGVAGAEEPQESLTIRPLEPADAPVCDAIIASLPYHFGDEQGREMCAAAVREQAGLVAVRSTAPVAFVTWRPWYAAAIEITWMAVHADDRCQGLGRSLVDALLGDAGPAVRYAVVTTLSEASPEPGVEDGYAGTRRFWQRCGFEPVWEPAGWWNDENQAVVMIRPLNG